MKTTTNPAAETPTETPEIWIVHWSVASGASACFDNEADALALAKAFQSANHYRGSAVVYMADQFASQFDGVIVWEAGTENVIPCRPHGITVEFDDAFRGSTFWRNGNCIASVDDAGGDAGFWCDLRSDAIHWFENYPIPADEAHRQVIKALRRNSDHDFKCAQRAQADAL